MRLLSSAIALDIVLALTQRRDGARLAELASAVGAPLSSAQTAMKLLVADGVVGRGPAGRPSYRLRSDHPAQDALIQLAARYAAPERPMAVVLKANPAVEYAACDRDGYLLVEAPLADPRDLVLLEDALRRIRRDDTGDPRIDRVGHHELVDALRDDSTLRRRAERATRLKGSLARSFPGHRMVGSSHDRRRSVAPVSRRALGSLARAHRLRRIRLFGSAARGELSDDSDVDVIVEPRPGTALSTLDLVRIEAELERLFERHVDVVTAGGLREEVRDRVERDAVPLYG